MQLTTIQYAYVVPTRSEIKRGAHWYRCDLIAGIWTKQEPGHTAAGRTLPLLKAGSVPVVYQLCTSGGPKYPTVASSDPHAFRAVALWHLSGRFPGKAARRDR
ncbi:hypothetical protein ACVW00_000020 [Marmoricola sp. URHA0025 HA25]